MPHFLPFARHEHEDLVQEIDEDAPNKRLRRSSLWDKFRSLKKHRNSEGGHVEELPEAVSLAEHVDPRRSSVPASGVAQRAVPSLPRPQTFQRQESERREKLLVVPPSPTERRAVSEDRRRGLSRNTSRRASSPKPVPLPSVSAPEIVRQDQQATLIKGESLTGTNNAQESKDKPVLPHLQIPDLGDGEVGVDDDDDEEGEIDQNSLQEEYDRTWILNLSMHFRDGSNREKFFITYAEKPTKWRRVTVSLDYRNAVPGSLEADLCNLHYQRDKSFRIYEAIRDSLPEIEYYNTVTNLKLETTREDMQLHVHVREDANEIITYPDVSLFDHVDVERYRESEVEFVSHLSGFVYEVNVGGSTFIKKEIPGPDTVDEFLYEINALEALLGSKHVIQMRGLVTDESGETVKGLLISYASSGTLVDKIYDERETDQLSWPRREKWARQIVQGLSDIHEAGYVQGDFTLSNIVIDDDDNAQVIDINRRGCPVGWEPPELGKLIKSGQRISMSISVKTDLFQLGMVLWALAEEEDEPERVQRPLRPVNNSIPTYYRRVVKKCLSERPQERSSAKRLLRHFPSAASLRPASDRSAGDFDRPDHGIAKHRSDKEYIDPDMAMTLDDVNPRHRNRDSNSSIFATGLVTYVDPHELDSDPEYLTGRFEDSESWDIVPRGRSPISSRRGRGSPYEPPSSSSATSLSGTPPSRSQRIRGSDCSADFRHTEHRSPSREFLTLQNSHTPTIQIDSDETPARPAELQDKRLAALRNEDAAGCLPLPHTDSGFDEHMIEELDLGPSEEDSTSHTDPCSCEPDLHDLHDMHHATDVDHDIDTFAFLPPLPPSPDFSPTDLENSDVLTLKPTHPETYEIATDDERHDTAQSLIDEPRQITTDA